MSDLDALKINISSLFKRTEDVCQSKLSLEHPDFVLGRLEDIARLNKRLLAVMVFIEEVAQLYERHADVDMMNISYTSKAYQDEVPGPVHHEFDVHVTGPQQDRAIYSQIELALLASSKHVQYIRLVAGAQDYEDVDLTFSFSRDMVSQCDTPVDRYAIFRQVAPLLAAEFDTLTDPYTENEHRPAIRARSRIA